jgi:hypothetical protein
LLDFSCQGNTAEKRNHEPLDEEEKRSEKLSNPENKLETSKIFKSTVLDDENEKVTNGNLYNYYFFLLVN